MLVGETVSVMPQAAPPAPTAPAATEKPKGAVGIWIGIVLIIAGIVLGIVLVVVGARSLISGFDDLQRVPISGGGVVRIEEPGTQTIYAEQRTSEGGSSFSSNTSITFAPNVAVRVIGPGGDDIPVDTSSMQETYVYDGYEGVSIGTFRADTAGTYRIVTQLQDSGPWSTIAVGNGLELSGIGAILGGVFGGGLIVLIGIILVIVFAVRRSRSKKRIAQASAPYPGGYGAAPGWPAPAAPGGYGAPPAPGGGAWPPASSAPGWAPPPVAAPGTPPPGTPPPGPTWTPPTSPPPQAPPATPWQQPPPPAESSWQPSGDAPPPASSSWQPSGDAPPPGAPPASDGPPPPPPSGGDGTSSS